MFSKIAIAATFAVASQAVRLSAPVDAPVVAAHQAAFNGSLANQAEWEKYAAANKVSMVESSKLRGERTKAVEAYFAAVTKEGNDRAAQVTASGINETNKATAEADATAEATATGVSTDAALKDKNAKAATVEAVKKQGEVKATQAGLVSGAEGVETNANAVEATAVAKA